MDNFLEEASQIFSDAGFARLPRDGFHRWFQRSENVAHPLRMAGSAYDPSNAPSTDYVAAVSLEREGRPIGRVYRFTSVELLRIYLPKVVSRLEADAAAGLTTTCPKCGAGRYPKVGKRGSYIECRNRDSQNIEDGYVLIREMGKAP
jgi:hypothetical protein